MKKQNLRYLLSILPVIAMFNVVVAQTSEPLSTFSSTSSKEVALNNKSSRPGGAGSGASTAGISAKALKNFSRNFKEADATWSNIGTGFVADFNKGIIRTKVFYTPKGQWQAMVRYYPEHNLPADIRHMVKSQYYDYTITIVIEVSTLNKVAYLVKMEDATSIKTIRVLDGEMDEYEAFEKSK